MSDPTTKQLVLPPLATHDPVDVRYAELATHIARMLIAERRSSRMSQEAVALAAGIAVPTYRALEGALTSSVGATPSLRTIVRVAILFGFEVVLEKQPQFSAGKPLRP